MNERRAESVPGARLPAQAGGGSSTLTSALCLHFETVDLYTARRLNALWHSRLPHLDPRVAAWLCFAATCDSCYHAIAIWSLPVARLLPQDGSCLELRRLALAPTAPKNAASRMIGWMVRQIGRCRPHTRRLISYQDCDTHAGTIYRASGWVAHPAPSGGVWNHGARHRLASRIPRKVRWEVDLSMPSRRK